MTETQVMRVQPAMYAEARHLAALRGTQPAELVAQAWREFLESHREEFAADLERAAEILRTGTRQDLAAFVNRNNAARAKEAAESLSAQT